MFKLDLEKAEEPEIKLPSSIGSQKKQESYRKTSTSALLTTPKPFFKFKFIYFNWKLIILQYCIGFATSLVDQMVKRLSTMWETWVRSLDREDPLEKEMAIHSSTIAWKIPWTEKPGRLQSGKTEQLHSLTHTST